MIEPEVSIIIRTLNEGKYLGRLLSSIYSQNCKYTFEVVLIDSGSTDKTLEIAKSFKCRITYIDKKDFSFGRSLNRGIEFSRGKYLVFISGHCIPTNEKWLEYLVQPLVDGIVQLTYGRQLAVKESYWSEKQIYMKYFPPEKRLPQEGLFCNNANSALLLSSWRKYHFNEELTGLEDMELSQRLVKDGGKLGYIPEASVYHIHHETWAQVRRRFEREAIALRKIFPEISISKRDVLKYILKGIINDLFPKSGPKPSINELYNIISYRVNQFIGSYKGNNYRSTITDELKNIYFYPIPSSSDISEIGNS